MTMMPGGATVSGTDVDPDSVSAPAALAAQDATSISTIRTLSAAFIAIILSQSPRPQ
jgi:hypothetical protein